MPFGGNLGTIAIALQLDCHGPQLFLGRSNGAWIGWKQDQNSTFSSLRQHEHILDAQLWLTVDDGVWLEVCLCCDEKERRLGWVCGNRNHSTTE